MSTGYPYGYQICAAKTNATRYRTGWCQKNGIAVTCGLPDRIPFRNGNLRRTTCLHAAPAELCAKADREEP